MRSTTRDSHLRCLYHEYVADRALPSIHPPSKLQLQLIRVWAPYLHWRPSSISHTLRVSHQGIYDPGTRLAYKSATCHLHTKSLHLPPRLPGIYLRRSPNMASVLNLPNELILAICEFLADDIPSLRAMCLTSRTISPLVQDILYDRVAFRKSEDRLWTLIRTFIDQPHLAQRARSLICKLQQDQKHEDGSQPNPMLQQGQFVGKVALCLSRLLPESPGVTGHITSSISSGNNQASFIALLLLLFPNLKELDLRPWYRTGAISSTGLVESIYGPLLDIGSDVDLRHVTGRLDGVQRLFLLIRIFKLLSFFNFKSIETLIVNLIEQGDNVSHMDDPAEFLTQTMAFQQLRHVIVYTTIDELEDESGFPREEPYLLPYITSAICAPSNSKPTQNTFQCLDLRILKSHTSFNSRCSLKSVVSAIQSLRDSLTDLKIVLPCEPPFRSEDWNIFRRVASCPNMDQFSQLTILVVSSDLLIHRSFRRPPHRQIDFTRLLPTSLKKLGLDHPGGIVVPWLKGLLHQISEFTDLGFIYLRCMPQRGRSASWFRKDKNASSVFEALKSHRVSICITDIAKGPPPRKDGSRGDILDVHDGALITDELGRRIPLYEAV